MIDASVLLQQVTAAMARPRHATYRLQLGPALGFDAVADLAPYLEALGIGDAYLSPCFKCAPGSSHGYDVTDYNAFNPEVGSALAFDRMVASLRARGLGTILDVVPNHMGIAGDANPWWLDVLENGATSSRAAFFDIDWAPAKPDLRDTVLLPVLPDQYGKVLEAGQLEIELVEGAFFVRYAGARLPLNPDSYAIVLRHGLETLTERLGAEHAGLVELQSILTSLEHLPRRTESDAARIAERLREKEIVKRRLGALVKESEEIRGALEDTVRTFNGTVGDPASFDHLDRLLSAQTYRLADWRVAGDEVNYRRFFDVNHLAAVRMERPEVFEAAHGLVLRLLAEGKISGLRIDHPDGLYAPAEYFRRLQEDAVLAMAGRLVPDLTPSDLEALASHYRARAAEHPEATEARPLWIGAEKIQMPGEPLPEWWVVAGTTGYDFLASVNGLFVDRGTSRRMTAIYTRFAGDQSGMADLRYAAKRLIMLVSMASEINQLGNQLDRISERDRLTRDFTLPSLIRALREIIAGFPVYRTYVAEDGSEPSPRDRAYIEEAVADAKRRNPTVNVSIYDFVRDVLLQRHPVTASPEERAARRHFALKFQQTTGPVTAKGVEDTALYRYNRLISLNEVGSDPARYGESVAAFHEKNARRLERWPDSLLCTATHDTKRGEDVRARIDVLSEVPEAWAAEARRWRELARRFKRQADGRAAPDRNDEYFVYQTLVGAWPASDADDSIGAFAARIRAYMEKATKEAKRHTSWVNPNVAYDEAVGEFVSRLLAPSSPFAETSRAFREKVALHGAVNSLAQTVLKVAAPGIPDFYQGAELWDLSLVDPDNRRPVDFARRRAALDDLQQRMAGAPDTLPALCADVLQRWPDGHVKLYATQRALTLRRDRALLFSLGAYVPLLAGGEHADHVVAFARRDGSGVVIVAVPRLTARLTRLSGRWALGADVWQDTWLSLGDVALSGAYRDRFSGRRLITEPRDGAPSFGAGALFDAFPVALLEREEARA